ncbi:hypothetical protein [Nocardiopsis suaedae]|uniref:DUF4352 domain-containing protein n=1 Tax=Nocardiopsis suaedae TaxID=3018444 RepID=A0ABT4TSN9_9ACTN|nr:hypothetical protein [Nocardiopsis suaedae]MDA2807274.1 hypothetical protein [Nocardiopsis suaedae]
MDKMLKSSVARIALLPVFSLALLMPSSAYAGEEDAGELEVLASASPAEAPDSETSVDVNQVVRADSSDYVSVTWTLNNESDGKIAATRFTNEVYSYNRDTHYALAGVKLINPGDESEFHPIKSPRQVCFCSGTRRNLDFVTHIESGESVSYWATFLLPQDIEEVSVEVRNFEPSEEVSIASR